LLNPRKEVHGAWDPLDDALRSQGDGALGPTRIIVIYDDADSTSDDLEAETEETEIDESDRQLLEKLSIFRFGCSKQAAYSMLNFRTAKGERLSWTQAQSRPDGLIDKKLVRRNRHVV